MAGAAESWGRIDGASAAAAVLFLLPELLFLTAMAVLAVGALWSFVRRTRARDSAAEAALTGAAVGMLVAGVIPAVAVTVKVAVATPPGIMITALAAAAVAVVLTVVASAAAVAMAASAVSVVRRWLAKDPPPSRW
ncbi:unnamed protein product [Spirodela intermedia]|uniref:Uncharacterized protein n=2 Tax=Spirodela intermedia TaxID=51605 RepID=A0A7I8LHR9_SPIIN|nr:unnamed protein product [Spirodela intermedia]CAA6672388.1 unnamed protein product [Spirodela intermedia]CAA7409571.1 unnamed protein product [Spirodela intermedia]